MIKESIINRETTATFMINNRSGVLGYEDGGELPFRDYWLLINCWSIVSPERRQSVAVTETDVLAELIAGVKNIIRSQLRVTPDGQATSRGASLAWFRIARCILLA